MSRTEADGPLITALLPTPLGPMLAGATDAGVALLEYADPPRLDAQRSAVRRALGLTEATGRHPLLDRLADELTDFFDGRRTDFSVPLLAVGTPFQLRAWDGLRAIPYGQTRSYADQAAAIGLPDAVRAVGRANGQNRLAILIPCHRVIGRDGHLCGYGGGLWRKRFLLDLERGEADASAADRRDRSAQGLLF